MQYNDYFKDYSLTELKQRGKDAKKLVNELFRHPTTVMIHADAGQMKSWLALTLAYAISKAGEFLNCKVPERKKVLYLDSEMDQESLGERLNLLNLTDNGYFTYAMPEKEIDLSKPEQQKMLLKKLLADGIEVLIWDNLRTSTLIDENSSADFAGLNQYLRQLRNNGISVFLLHHNNKADEYAGSSNAKTVFDAVIGLHHHTDRIKQIKVSKDRHGLLSEVNGKLLQIDLETGYSVLKQFDSSHEMDAADALYRAIEEIKVYTVKDALAFLRAQGLKFSNADKPESATFIYSFLKDNSSISTLKTVSDLEAKLAGNRVFRGGNNVTF